MDMLKTHLMGPFGLFLPPFLFTETTTGDKKKKPEKVLPGFEPGTFCVLGRCDNHYTTAPHS